MIIALARNNDRAWFNGMTPIFGGFSPSQDSYMTWVLNVITTEHDGLYKGAKSDFESFVESTSKIIVEIVDETIPELPLKDLVSVLCYAFLCVDKYAVTFSVGFSRPAEIHDKLYPYQTRAPTL